MEKDLGMGAWLDAVGNLAHGNFNHVNDPSEIRS